MYLFRMSRNIEIRKGKYCLNTKWHLIILCSKRTLFDFPSIIVCRQSCVWSFVQTLEIKAKLKLFYNVPHFNIINKCYVKLFKKDPSVSIVIKRKEMAKETLGLANLQFRAKYPSFRFTPSFDSRVTFPPASAYALFFSSSRHFCRFIFQHGHLFFSAQLLWT
jgi:hypothetical protein